MAQGRFTKEEATKMRVAVKEMFEALSESKQREHILHFNDIVLFLAAARAAAPD